MEACRAHRLEHRQCPCGVPAYHLTEEVEVFDDSGNYVRTVGRCKTCGWSSDDDGPVSGGRCAMKNDGPTPQHGHMLTLGQYSFER
jgi:hypothetical protein